MKIIRELLFLVVITFILTSSSTVSVGSPSNTHQLPLVKSKEVLSPFTQFENLKNDADQGFNNEQVNSILRSYGVYDSILAKVPKEYLNNSNYSDVGINGFSIGNKKVALLQLNKGHEYIYVLFSNKGDKWAADGFVYLSERYEPEYRIQKSGDQTKYWLVVKHEANHGTGLQIFDEIWYNPDGSVAGEYPVEGYSLFFPLIIEPEANTYFSTSAYYDGDSKISLSYLISFEYGYKENSQGFSSFQSKYLPAIRENWSYDLKTQQLKFISCDPALPDSFSTMKHVASSEYGILQGYFDFYRTRLGDMKVTTLGEWEKFMGLK